MKILACACVLMVLMCLQRLETVSGQPSEPICGLPGYNVTTLSLASYWNISLPKPHCLTPHGVSEEDIATCSLVFSICRSLPEQLCPSKRGLSRSVCQVVTLKNGTTVHYNQGFYNTEQETYTVVTNTTVDGFFIGWNGSTPEDARQCNHALRTLILFECNQTVKWDPGAPTSARLKDVISFDCNYLITVLYSGACFTPPTLAPSTCSLPPYDIGTLSERDYWTAMINPQLCIGGSASFTCTLNFAFCHSLPRDITTSSPCSREPTSVCQTAEGVTGSTQSFSLGKFSQCTHFLQKSEQGVGGFMVEFTNGSSSSSCPNGSNTTIVFNCDSNAVWNNIDISQYTNISIIPTQGVCKYLITVLYSGACFTPPTLAPSTCSLPPYDIDTLSENNYWTAIIDPQLCISPDSVTCLMTFAFCQALPWNISIRNSPCSKEPTAVCQTAVEKTGLTQSFSLGKFSTSTHFHPKEGVEGFFVEYINGSNSTVCPNGSRSKIVFNCDKNATWKTSDISNYIRGINVPTNGVCEFEINVNYSGACIPVSPSPRPGGSKTFPIGWIGWGLIGIFLFVVLTYFIIGLAYQYFHVGARGLEIIPNSAFWVTFWKLVLEGCIFLLNFVTCYYFKDGFKYKKQDTKDDEVED